VFPGFYGGSLAAYSRRRCLEKVEGGDARVP
jgi:hypothetical protein